MGALRRGGRPRAPRLPPRGTQPPRGAPRCRLRDLGAQPRLLHRRAQAEPRPLPAGGRGDPPACPTSTTRSNTRCSSGSCSGSRRGCREGPPRGWPPTGWSRSPRCSPSSPSCAGRTRVRCGGSRPRPLLLLTSAINWDLVGIAFLVASVVFFGERRHALSGVAAALGTCFKLFPVVVAPVALGRARFGLVARVTRRPPCGRVGMVEMDDPLRRGLCVGLRAVPPRRTVEHPLLRPLQQHAAGEGLALGDARQARSDRGSRVATS